MNTNDDLPRIHRRVAIQWMLGATAALATRDAPLFAADAPIKAKGYGPDPVMVKAYKPGDVWPLTFSDAQRRTAHALCDVIIPADDTSPSAAKKSTSAVGRGVRVSRTSPPWCEPRPQRANGPGATSAARAGASARARCGG